MKYVRLPTMFHFVSIDFIEHNKSKTKVDLVPPKPNIIETDFGRDFIYIRWEIGTEPVYRYSVDAFLNQIQHGSTTSYFYKYPTLLPNHV